MPKTSDKKSKKNTSDENNSRRSSSKIVLRSQKRKRYNEDIEDDLMDDDDYEDNYDESEESEEEVYEDDVVEESEEEDSEEEYEPKHKKRKISRTKATRVSRAPRVDKNVIERDEMYGQVDQILARRKVEKHDKSDDKKSTENVYYEYLIKWIDKAHYENSWEPLERLKKIANTKLNNFEKRNPPPDDVNYFQKEWNICDFIIGHNEEGQYLVKWRGLGCDSATWEDKDVLEDKIEGGKEALQSYSKREIYEAPEKITAPQKENHKPHSPLAIASDQKLKSYQVESVNWLLDKYYSSTNALLADEMGLGKTVQTIAFLCNLHRQGVVGPFLIVAPLSTLDNWQREFKIWAPHLSSVILSGGADARSAIKQYGVFFENDGKKLMKVNAVITSYSAITIESAFFRKFKWQVLAVDEAHRLKSRGSKLLKTLKTFDVGWKLLLTGTPLQNNLPELWNLMNYIAPQTFSNLAEFEKEFVDCENVEIAMDKLRALLKNHMLRRLKYNVEKGLPPKIELVVRVQMTALQKFYYKNILIKNFSILKKGLHGNSQSSKSKSFNNIVVQLIKCCNHPYLFLSQEQEPEAKDENEEYKNLVHASAKMLLLDSMLEKLKKRGHRVLIYSQMTQLLDIIEDYINYKGYRFERIDGSVEGLQRQSAIDRFNNDKDIFIFLLSTNAGGIGINLYTADTVILYDSRMYFLLLKLPNLDYNPHMDVQALSRAHRIGQENKVMVYRLVCSDSVEERVLQIAKKKKVLENLVMKNVNEMHDIIKYGTDKLFKDDEDEKKTEKDLLLESSLENVGFTDEQVEKLIDARDDPQQLEASKQQVQQESMDTFEILQQNEPVDHSSMIENLSKQTEDDDHYWDKLIGDKIRKAQSEKLTELGKGKRIRKRINYAEQLERRTEEDPEDTEFTVPDDADTEEEPEEDIDEEYEDDLIEEKEPKKKTYVMETFLVKKGKKKASPPPPQIQPNHQPMNTPQSLILPVPHQPTFVRQPQIGQMVVPVSPVKIPIPNNQSSLVNFIASPTKKPSQQRQLVFHHVNPTTRTKITQPPMPQPIPQPISQPISQPIPHPMTQSNQQMIGSPFKQKPEILVLGFNKKERIAFYEILTSWGIFNANDENEWKRLYEKGKNNVHISKKTLEEFTKYGKLFMKHLRENVPSNAKQFADGTPLEFNRTETLEIIARIFLVNWKISKCKSLEDFSIDVKEDDTLWNKKNDYCLLKGILKHGYRKWHDIFTDKEFNMFDNVPEMIEILRPKLADLFEARTILLCEKIMEERTKK